jgi:hypothetical protein
VCDVHAAARPAAAAACSSGGPSGESLEEDVDGDDDDAALALAFRAAPSKGCTFEVLRGSGLDSGLGAYASRTVWLLNSG